MENGMADPIRQGNFEAVAEPYEHDNFATSIYEVDYDGLLIARCNQNGNHPHQVAAILNGLNGKAASADLITAHRAEIEALRRENQELRKALEPFATAGRIIDGPFGPALFAEDHMAFQSGCAWSENGEKRTITWGDFRRANAAIRALTMSDIPREQLDQIKPGRREAE